MTLSTSGQEQDLEFVLAIGIDVHRTWERLHHVQIPVLPEPRQVASLGAGVQQVLSGSDQDVLQLGDPNLASSSRGECAHRQGKVM